MQPEEKKEILQVGAARVDLQGQTRRTQTDTCGLTHTWDLKKLNSWKQKNGVCQGAGAGEPGTAGHRAQASLLMASEFRCNLRAGDGGSGHCAAPSKAAWRVSLHS